MKHLLYTFLLGLVIISCNKEDLGGNNAPLALSQEIELTGDIFLDFILENSNNYTAKKGTANLTSKGSDYLQVGVFSEDGFTYLMLIDESNDDLCFGEKDVTISYWNNSAGDGSVLSVEDAEENELRTISGNFASLFSASFNTIIKLTLTASDLTINGDAIFDEVNRAVIQ